MRTTSEPSRTNHDTDVRSSEDNQIDNTRMRQESQAPNKRQKNDPKFTSPTLAIGTAMQVRTFIDIASVFGYMGVITLCVSPWLFVPENISGTRLSWVVLSTEKLKTMAQSLIPSTATTNVYVEAALLSWESRLSKQPVIVLVFEHGLRPPKARSSAWTAGSPVQMILAERTLRERVPEGWVHKFTSVSHHLLGGVTNWEGPLHVSTRSRSFIHESPETHKTSNTIALQQGPQSVLGHLVDQTITGKHCEPPGKNDFDCFEHKLHFHCLVKNKDPYFKLPCVFAPAKYTHRRLATKELLLALDVLGHRIKAWCGGREASSGDNQVVKLFGSPVKVTQAIGAWLKPQLRELIIQADSNSSRKRQRLEEPSLHDAESQRYEERDAMRQIGANHAKRCRTTYTTGQQELSRELQGDTKDMKIWWPPNPRNKENRDTTLSELARKQFNVFNHVGSQEIEPADAKAVKSDDAEIPIHLWNDRISFLLDS
ncbi:hypothetical protein ACA910_007614 [Epithemia clementina (nom. ined.)]